MVENDIRIFQKMKNKGSLCIRNFFKNVQKSFTIIKTCNFFHDYSLLHEHIFTTCEDWKHVFFFYFMQSEIFYFKQT